VTAFVARVQAAGEALLVAGEAGVGKTALLDAAAEMASAAGSPVLRAAAPSSRPGLCFAELQLGRWTRSPRAH
jgi:ABC-type taurine transport system ATPase subunit